MGFDLAFSNVHLIIIKYAHYVKNSIAVTILPCSSPFRLLPTLLIEAEPLGEELTLRLDHLVDRSHGGDR